MEKIKAFAHRNPVRVAAWVSSSVAILLSVFAPDMPIEPVVTFVLAALGLGEYAQRIENSKTEVALYTDPEDDEDDEDA